MLSKRTLWTVLDHYNIIEAFRILNQVHTYVRTNLDEVTNSIKFIYSVRTTKCVKSRNFFDATKEFEIKFHSSSQNI